MAEDADLYACPLTYVETFRALVLAEGRSVARRFQLEWPAVAVVEIDDELVRRAAELAVSRRLRSLDAVHLAAATSLPEGTMLLTWDRRLHAAARAEGLAVLPEALA